VTQKKKRISSEDIAAYLRDSGGDVSSKGLRKRFGSRAYGDVSHYLDGVGATATEQHGKWKLRYLAVPLEEAIWRVLAEPFRPRVSKLYTTVKLPSSGDPDWIAYTQLMRAVVGEAISWHGMFTESGKRFDFEEWVESEDFAALFGFFDLAVLREGMIRYFRHSTREEAMNG